MLLDSWIVFWQMSSVQTLMQFESPNSFFVCKHTKKQFLMCQCLFHLFLWAAHFGATVLKMRPTERAAACQRSRKFGFFKGETLMNGLTWDNPSPQAFHFHRVSLAGSSGAMRYQAKPYHPGQRLQGPVRGPKKRDRKDMVTVNKTHQRQSENLGLILSILRRMALRTTTFATAATFPPSTALNSFVLLDRAELLNYPARLDNRA